MNKDISHVCQISKLITLKLEGEETVLYVNEEKFQQCKYLFIVNPEKITPEDANSIDDVKEFLGKRLEEEIIPKDLGLTAEELFWGHCSNLQAWVESNYDTQLLHSNLAFPLLKKLTKAGDPIARRIFKEEIVERFLNGSNNTRTFLCDEGYLTFLNKEELSLILDPLSINILSEIGKEINREQEFHLNVSSIKNYANAYRIENRVVTELKISGSKSEYRKKLPEEIKQFTRLKFLTCYGFNLETLPDWINQLKILRELNLPSNNIERLIDLKLPNLEKLDLSYNKLRSAGFSGCELPNLKTLKLFINQISSVEGLDNLPSLEELILSNNKMQSLPQALLNLANLKELDISFNKISNNNKILTKLKEKGIKVYNLL
ncbi:MAG: leucine-rich repeat domain-containing protein [Promethearchaeota archaeon]|nr:MAG: leucine-rich repeat domain-containing protein [Candidatus Lokiarchaeota archaeon]